MSLRKLIRCHFSLNPDEAVAVATKAMLCMVSDNGELLDENESWPPGSGADYVDDMTNALMNTKAGKLVRGMQRELGSDGGPREKPFSLLVNLDDEIERNVFLEKYGEIQGLQLARRLGFRGKGAKAAADALRNYAISANTAAHCRRAGSMAAAEGHSLLCDRIYAESIAPFIRCW